MLSRKAVVLFDWFKFRSLLLYPRAFYSMGPISFHKPTEPIELLFAQDELGEMVRLKRKLQ